MVSSGFFLAVETSQDRGSLAVGKIQTQELLSIQEWPSDLSAKASHSESLHQYTQMALQEAKIDLKDLSLLIVDVGPGSFTGVRVGINFVRSLAYALNIPVHPISSLAVLASRQFLEGKQIAESILPSLGTEFYYAKYEKNSDEWKELIAPQLKINAESNQIPRPWSVKDLIQCAFSRLSTEHCEWKQLFPLYLRGSQAEEKMKRTVKT